MPCPKTDVSGAMDLGSGSYAKSLVYSSRIERANWAIRDLLGGSIRAPASASRPLLGRPRSRQDAKVEKAQQRRRFGCIVSATQGIKLEILALRGKNTMPKPPISDPVVRQWGTIFCTRALLAALLLLGQCSFAAAVLYSNLGPNGQYGTGGGYALSGANFGSQATGMSFYPNANMNLLDAVLALGFYRGNNSPINVYLEGDASGFPGSILDDLTQIGNIPPLPGGLITFDCTSCPLLQAGKEYWLVAVEPDANSDQTWMFAYQYPTQESTPITAMGRLNGPWSETPGNLSGFSCGRGIDCTRADCDLHVRRWCTRFSWHPPAQSGGVNRSVRKMPSEQFLY